MAQGGHTGLVLGTACLSHSHRSFGYHSPLGRGAGKIDRFCAEVQDLIHKALEVVDEQDRLAQLRRDLQQRGDCCD